MGPSQIIQNNSVITNLLPNSLWADTERPGAILTRIVGKWAMKIDTIDLDGQLSIGLYMQRLEAFSAGVNPELEADLYSYVHWDTMTGRIALADTADDNGNRWWESKLDIRSKRKFRSPQDTVVFLAENTSEDSVTISRLFTLRLLLWIP